MKTAKDLSFINLNALNPSISPAETVFPFSFGGVCGRVKAYSPRAKDAIAPISKVFEVKAIEFHSVGGGFPPKKAGHESWYNSPAKKLLPTSIPEAIHPIVPKVLKGIPSH